MKYTKWTRIGFTLVLSLVISGCVSPNLYDWGEYDQLLYKQYKDPAARGDFVTGLTEHIQKLEKEGKMVAPGMYAELGTLHLEDNDYESARVNYQKESELWPESRVLMDKLIKAVKRRQSRLSTTPAALELS